MNIKKHYDSIATGFGIGKFKTKISPENFGSFAALLVWILISYLFAIIKLPLVAGNVVFFCLILFVVALGAVSSDSYAYKAGEENPREIVIDEFCGQLFALWLVSIIIGSTIIVSFFAFLIFNIFVKIKPAIIIEYTQKFKGGIRIMIDDILFAVATAITGYFIYEIFYLIMRLSQTH